MTYHLITYGCQMNKSDSERLAAVLESKGYKHSPTPQRANLVVINMCSVRQKPVDKAINKIKTLRHPDETLRHPDETLRHPERSEGSQNMRFFANAQNDKNKEIIATGCILEKDKKKLAELGVEIKGFRDLEKIKPKSAFVPITRGCNNFCTYCAVPYARGRERHRPIKKILAEVKQLIKDGHKEIMLLGQNVNSYRWDPSPSAQDDNSVVNFVGLLRKVTALRGNFRIKFITNHPKDFSDELIQEMAQNPKIVKYVHLPFQAGDNTILKKMNRHYTRQHYLKLVEKIKKAMPDVEITTDVIVGFPGETKKQFQNTVKVAKEVGFAQIYIGKYSPRAGTAAALLEDNVPLEEKKRREQTLRKLIVT